MHPNNGRKDVKAGANDGWLKQTGKKQLKKALPRRTRNAWLLWWIFPYLSWIAFYRAASNVLSCRLAAKLSWLAWLRWFCLMKSWRVRHTRSRTRSSQTTTQINVRVYFLILCELIPGLLGNTTYWTLEVSQTHFNDQMGSTKKKKRFIYIGLFFCSISKNV